MANLLNDQQFLAALRANNAERRSYYLMYSSWLGGFVTDPALMLVPGDDHIVHRGDGVFEAIRTHAKKPYLLQEHLERMGRSAERIGLRLPMPLDQIAALIHESLSLVEPPEVMIRLFISRGPGGFTSNPYESMGSQLYLYLTKMGEVPPEKYENGVRIGRSAVPVKEGFFPRVKSCNYLPNVLMKRESVDRGLEFTVAFTNSGYLAESSTENIVIVDEHGALCHPRTEYILGGTTMLRLFALAKSHLADTGVSSVVERDITEEDLYSAREAMIMGTTMGVLSVVEYEGKPIGAGKPGKAARRLRELYLEDLAG